MEGKLCRKAKEVQELATIQCPLDRPGTTDDAKATVKLLRQDYECPGVGTLLEN
jgi:hypothetical protein